MQMQSEIEKKSESEMKKKWRASRRLHALVEHYTPT
jgi:hypothetical protein